MSADKVYNLALRYLGRRPRSVKEMKQYLSKKAASASDIKTTINRLLELKYLNDREFARQFISSRIRFKPKSVYALGYELRQKGISQGIVDDTLSALDNMQLARSAVHLKVSQWHHLNQGAQKKN